VVALVWIQPSLNVDPNYSKPRPARIPGYQEIWITPYHQEPGKKTETYQEIARLQKEYGPFLICRALVWQRKSKKYEFKLSIFQKIPGKNLAFGLMARKMAYYYLKFTRKLPNFDTESASGNHQEAPGNSGLSP
jgi:hypothetical protein